MALEWGCLSLNPSLPFPIGVAQGKFLPGLCLSFPFSSKEIIIGPTSKIWGED